MKLIRIAIVDDHSLFRNGVTRFLEEFEELQVVFEAENGKVMQELIGKGPLPDVVLMDINMPEADGYEATKWIKIYNPDIHVLALSMYEEDDAVIKMIKCGAGGYVLKQARPRELLDAIKVIAEKGVYFNEIVSGRLIRTITLTDSAPRLTEKETEFLKLTCSELTYKEIADRMFVSPRTIDNYRESLFVKLNLKSRTGLVLYAIKNNLVHIK